MRPYEPLSQPLRTTTKFILKLITMYFNLEIFKSEAILYFESSVT